MGAEQPETIAAIVAAHRAGTLTPAQTVARTISASATTTIPPSSSACATRRTRSPKPRRLRAKDAASLPLYGVPVAVKDNIDVAGFPTTAACPAFSYTPTHDATAVARLRAAGAIIIGKTNLDQFATGLVGVRSPYGIPSNPIRERSHSGRIEFGLGGRGRRRTGAAVARHRHRRLAAACRRCSTTSSG